MMSTLRDTEQYLERLHAERASAWLEILPSANAAQRAEFVAWLKESPRNVQEFLVVQRLEQELLNLDADHIHDVRALLAEARDTVLHFPVTPEFQEAVPAHPIFRRRLMQAAGIALLLVGGWFTLFELHVNSRVYQTAVGEQRAFELEDGSVIDLNTHSRIEVRLSRSSREVHLLEGEALFQVRHNVAKPFRVYTGDSIIDDVGTQFDVYRRPGGTVIAVLEGQIDVVPVDVGDVETGRLPRNPEAQVNISKYARMVKRKVSANQVAEIGPAGDVSIQTVTDVSDAISWRDRRLVFRQQSLRHIVEEFNRYNAAKIRIEDPAAENRLFTGVFNADDIESFEQVLSRDPDLIVEKMAQETIIRRR